MTATERMKYATRRIYLFGPGSLTVFMVAGSIAYFPFRHWDTWAVYPIWIGGLIAIMWHISLLNEDEGRLFGYGIYALVNMVLYVVLGFVCLMMVTGEFL